MLINKKRLYPCIMFAIIYFIYFFSKTSDYILLIKLTIYSLVVFLLTYLTVVKAEYNFTSPIVWFSGLYVLLICLGPLILLPIKYDYKFDILTTNIIAYICFLIGCFYIKLPVLKMKYRKIKICKINKETILLALIAFSGVVWTIYIIKNKNLIFANNFENDRITSQFGNGAYLYLIRMWILTIPMYYEELLKKKKVNMLFYGIVCFATFALLILGGRTPILIIFIELIVCNIVVKKVPTKKMIKFAIIMVLIVGMLGFLRGMISNSSNANLISSIKSIMLNGNYNLNYIFNKFPKQIPFQYGYTYLINFQMLMPGPDIDFTLWLKEKLGLKFNGGGVTPTIIGEFYINFGYFGIAIGMLIMGILFRKLNIFLEKHNDKAFAIFICLQMALSVSGGIANYFINIILYTLVYIFINSVSNDTLNESKQEEFNEKDFKNVTSRLFARSKNL